MTLFPVVERELRVAARRPFTYWGRAAAGLVAVAVIGWLALVDRGGTSQDVGRQLFAVGSSLAFFFALAAGPSFTADSISGERREGTLGLLFLTDLKGRDIAVGKLLATSLGCASYLMASVPVLGVALLLGGVGAGEGVRVVLVLANTLLFSLSAGLLASILSTTSRGASGVASLLVVGGTGGVPAAGMLLLWVFGQWDGSAGMAEWWMEHVFLPPSVAAPMVTAFEGSYRGAKGAASFLGGMVFTHVLAWVFFGLTAWRLPRIWQDTGRDRAARPGGMSGTGADPEASAVRRLRLDLSPFVWLAERWPWRRRLVWVFLSGAAAVFVTLGMLFGDDWLDAPGYLVTSLLLHLVMKYWIASEAPRQFFEDRRNGAMELMLGTPLTVEEIVRGRFLALQRQFLGPIVVVTAADFVALLASQGVSGDGDSGEWMLLWLSRMVLLWVDAVALAWTGMWIGLVGHGNRTTGAAFSRVVLLPWLVVFALGTFLGVSRSLNNWGFAGFLGVWLVLNVGNALFWIHWSRGGLLREFRERATVRPGEGRRQATAAASTSAAPG